MSYPQDPKSRLALFKNEQDIQHWGLVVVVNNQLLELQSWSGDSKTGTTKPPEGLFVDFKPDGNYLLLYMRKKICTWNPATGSITERPYKKGETKGINPFQAVAGEPQFRGKNKWCAVVIDGDVKACPPKQLFRQSQQRWKSQPIARKLSLLSGPILVVLGQHGLFAVKAALVTAMTGVLLLALALLVDRYL